MSVGIAAEPIQNVKDVRRCAIPSLPERQAPRSSRFHAGSLDLGGTSCSPRLSLLLLCFFLNQLKEVWQTHRLSIFAISAIALVEIDRDMFHIHASHSRSASIRAYDPSHADREPRRLLNHPHPAMRLNRQVGAPI